jgi:hypothetical protein
MSQPAMCPFCGTSDLTSLSCDEGIHPSVRGETNAGITFLFFSCESGHIFMTLKETFESVEAIASGPLYERHRRN